MRNELSPNTKISLTEFGTENTFEFTIINTVGAGASCIVYTAVHNDTDGNLFHVRLKEFYPDNADIKRNSDNSLEITGDVSDALKRFVNGYKKQLKLRQIPESMNSISNIQGIFEGNNTRYIAMSCQNGISIDEADLSLYDVFRVLKAITLQIKNFHDNGYLYLDLKPANVILYPETPELVMLFDFDSAVEKDDLSLDNLSFTQKWSAPEVVQKNLGKIGVRSDIYTLGALFMYMLFGRSPELSDRRRNANWNNDFEASFLSEESPETKRIISNILRKTLSADAHNRYDSCDELLDVIESFIVSFQMQKPYLKTVIPMNNNYFCGRDREITEVHEILLNEHFLVLHGIGGIGKSELAKHYAENYFKDYDAVIFMRFNNSIIETVASDSNLPIINFKRSDDESEEEYFERKINILRKITTPRHLIILDNFDTDECENIDELLSLNCKFIITSRIDFEDVFPQYEVDILDDIEYLNSIYTYYSKLDCNNYADNIIIALEGHTMAVELVSKQMRINGLTAEEMYAMLCEKGIYANEEKIKNLKDGTLRNRSAYAHIELLFTVFGLDDAEKKVLKCLSLIGTTPMAEDYFNVLCESNEEEKSCLHNLIKGGWAQTFTLNEFTCISLHPLICEVLLKQLKPECNELETFVFSASTAAMCISDICDATERNLNIQWLDHMAHNINGVSDQLALFFGNMAFPLYMSELNYTKTLWAIKREIEILENIEDNENRLISAYISAKMVANRMKNDEEYKYFDSLLKKMQLSDQDQINVLKNEFLEFIMDANMNAALDTAFRTVEFAEKIGDDKILALAYEQMVMAAYYFPTNIDKEMYAQLALNHFEKYANEDIDLIPEKTTKRADIYSELADLYMMNERFNDAIIYSQKSIEQLEAIYDDTSRLASQYSTIAVCFQRLENAEKSFEYFDLTINCIKNHYGDEHPELIDTFISYTKALIQFYNSTENVEYLLKCKETFENIFDIAKCSEYIDDVHINNSYLSYSTVLACLGEFDESYKYDETAMQFFYELYDDDERMANVYLTIGDNYLKANDKNNAKTYYDLAIRNYEKNGLDSEELQMIINDVLKI